MFTMEKDLNAKHVKKDSAIGQISMPMKRDTQMTDYFSAVVANIRLEQKMDLNAMREFIQMKGHSSATHVQKAFLQITHLKNMKSFILGKFHFSAKHVKKDSTIDQISLLMKRDTQMKENFNAVVAKISFDQKLI